MLSASLRVNNRPMHKRPTREGRAKCEEVLGRDDDEREEDGCFF